MQYRIAIIVQNIIQWYSIRKLAIFLRKKKDLLIDIYLYDPNTSSNDFHQIAKETATAIKADSFTPLTKLQNHFYKICMAPYSNMISLNCQYKLGYCYGAATTKPQFTLNPPAKIGFHGLFVHDSYGADLFSIYGKTYIVPDLYIETIAHHKKTSKPTILYLPTYHEPSTTATAKSLSALKEKYNIIIKNHHGIDNLDDEQDKKDLLSEIANTIFPSTYPIKKLFERCDVVLSDNSGAAMDALYANIPVAISAYDINKSIPNVPTIQHQLVERGIIPFASSPTPENIDSIISTALSKEQHAKQIHASEKLFPVKTGGAETWYKIISLYLKDEISQNYTNAHDYLSNTYYELEKTANTSIILQSRIDNLEAKLAYYEHSRAHRAVKRLHGYFHKSR